MRFELLSKQKAKKEQERVAEIAEVIPKVKGSAVVVVWEARIKDAQDVVNAGSWNVASCHESLAKLTREPVNTNQDPIGKLKVRGQEKEAENVLGDDNQAKV